MHGDGSPGDAKMLRSMPVAVSHLLTAIHGIRVASTVRPSISYRPAACPTTFFKPRTEGRHLLYTLSHIGSVSNRDRGPNWGNCRG